MYVCIPYPKCTRYYACSMLNYCFSGMPNQKPVLCTAVYYCAVYFQIECLHTSVCVSVNFV